MFACCPTIIFGPAITLLHAIGRRLAARSPEPVLQFAAVVLPAAVAATQLLLGEPAALRQVLAHTLLTHQVLESFVGQAAEVLQIVEAAQPGEVQGQRGTDVCHRARCRKPQSRTWVVH